MLGLVISHKKMETIQNLFFCSAHMDARDQPIVDAMSAERQSHMNSVCT